MDLGTGQTVAESEVSEVSVKERCERGCCPSPAEHYRSLAFMATGQGTVHARERQLQRDRDAYKRLREDGLQPSRVDGSALKEATANTKHEVES